MKGCYIKGFKHILFETGNKDQQCFFFFIPQRPRCLYSVYSLHLYIKILGSKGLLIPYNLFILTYAYPHFLIPLLLISADFPQTLADLTDDMDFVVNG